MNTTEHPCADRRCLPLGFARFYTLFRGIIAALLFALILALWGRGGADTATVTTEVTPVATITVPAASTDTAAPVVLTAALVGAAKIGGFTLTDGRACTPFDISGTGEPEATLDLLANGKSFGTTLIGTDGKWQYTDTVCLDKGRTDVTARMALPDGGAEEVKLRSLVLNDTLFLQPEGKVIALENATVEEAPEEPEPAPVAAITIDSISNGVIDGEEAEICGSVEPNAQVSVVVDGAIIGKTSADGSGQWCYTGSFSAGEYNVEARDITDSSDSSPRSTATAQSMVILAAAVVEETPAEEATFELGEVASVGETPTIGTVDFGMAGTGTPGMQVVILEDGVIVGGAVAQDDGTWSCTCMLPPGEHVLIAQDADDPENSAEEVTFFVENLTVAPTPPTADPGSSGGETFSCVGRTPEHGELVGTVYFVAECEWMELIAQRLGTTVAEIMRYNPQITSTTLIYPGQALNVPGAAGCFDNNHDG